MLKHGRCAPWSRKTRTRLEGAGQAPKAEAEVRFEIEAEARRKANAEARRSVEAVVCEIAAAAA
jgi:hypothetical protein